jgi:hypothetical protein
MGTFWWTHHAWNSLPLSRKAGEGRTAKPPAAGNKFRTYS